MAEKKTRARKPAPATPPPLTLPTTWAAAVLGLLVVLFFHALVLEGKTFVSPDALAPAGFVRVGEQALYHDHVYPLWNPYVFLGMPSFASGAYNPLIYPPDWPLAIVQKVLPFLPDMTWMLLYYVLAGLFTFLLAREWGASAEGALIGAAAFVFAPNLIAVGSHGHGSQLVDSAYLPLMLWLATRWMRRGGLADLGWLALAGGFQFLRGHAQICFYTWIAIAIYLACDVIGAFVRRGDVPPATRLARAAAVGAAMALAFGIAAFYNLPLRDYARWSIRGAGEGGGVGLPYATSWSMGPWELPSVVIPWAVGFGGQTYWGGMPFTDYPNAYMGMVAVVALVPALLDRGVPRVTALLLALVALAVSFGKYFPLYGFLYDHLPLFNKFRVPVMIIVLFQLAIALGAAWGWSRVLREHDDPAARSRVTGRLLLGAGVVLAIALVVGVGGQDAMRDGYVRSAMAHRPGYPGDAAAFTYQRYVADLLRACVLGLAALALLWLTRAGRIARLPATAILLVLVLIELWPVSGEVMHPVIGDRQAVNLELGRDDVIDYLEKAGPPGSFRILPLDEFQSNRFAGFAIASVGGAHAAKPRLAQDWIDRVLSNGLDWPRLMPWLRLLNVRYLVAHQRLPSSPGLTMVHDGPGGQVLEVPGILPRATAVGAYRVAASGSAVIDSISAGAADPATVTWLERDPRLALGPVTGAKAEITSYRLNDLSVHVTTPGPALLRVADLWYPDWVATVDGKPAELLRADHMLRAVPVPAGTHTVEFRFHTEAVRLGLLISIASLIAALALLAVGLVRGRGGRAASRPASGPTPEPAGAR
jgi:hypothetical protein